MAALAVAALVACGDNKSSINDPTTTLPPVPTEGPTLSTTSTTVGATTTIITVPPTMPPPPTTCKPCNVSTVPTPPSTNKDGTLATTTVPGGTAPATTTATSAPAHQSYTVQSGDTLGTIASKFHTTVAALQSLNGISNPDSIYAGEVIKIS